MTAESSYSPSPRATILLLGDSCNCRPVTTAPSFFSNTVHGTVMIFCVQMFYITKQRLSKSERVLKVPVLRTGAFGCFGVRWGCCISGCGVRPRAALGALSWWWCGYSDAAVGEGGGEARGCGRVRKRVILCVLVVHRERFENTHLLVHFTENTHSYAPLHNSTTTRPRANPVPCNDFLRCH